MDKFEFYFALLALLIGLALTQLAGGMASALKLRAKIHIGWLTPLAALVICFDIASLWPALWSLRAVVEIRMEHILAGTALCLGYYMAAAFVFPDNLAETEDLDAWFFAYRRFALGGTLAVSMLSSILTWLVLPGPFDGMSIATALWDVRGWIVYVVLMAIPMVVRSKRLCIASLAAILCLYPLQPVLFA